jgi:hypothetical protein
VYAGAVGRFDFAHDEMDTCIAIRMMTFKDGTVYLQAGGGIVFDSVEEEEYIETVNKLSGSLRALEEAESESRLCSPSHNSLTRVGQIIGMTYKKDVPPKDDRVSIAFAGLRKLRAISVFLQSSGLSFLCILILSFPSFTFFRAYCYSLPPCNTQDSSHQLRRLRAFVVGRYWIHNNPWVNVGINDSNSGNVLYGTFTYDVHV